MLHGLGVILLQHSLVLRQQGTLLLLHNRRDPLFFSLLRSKLLDLQVALLLINGKLFLPKSLDFSLVLLLAHPASLSVHLL